MSKGQSYRPQRYEGLELKSFGKYSNYNTLIVENYDPCVTIL